MSPIDQLKAVLCDPTGKCCIDGSDEDRAIIDRALQALAQPEPTPRQLQRIRQRAWQGIKQDVYRADPEVCFAMGFDVGYGAVASKVEPSQEKCGGFDSRPAPLKEWVGLTDEERHAYTQSPFTEENYRAVESRLKEKNT